MQIEFLEAVAGANFAYRPGEIADLHEDSARDFLKAGLARLATGTPEAAVVAAPENAMAPRARGRRRIAAGLFS